MPPTKTGKTSYDRLYTTLSRRISFLLRTPWRCTPRSAEGAPLILDALPDLSMPRDGAVSGAPSLKRTPSGRKPTRLVDQRDRQSSTPGLLWASHHPTSLGPTPSAKYSLFKA